MTIKSPRLTTSAVIAVVVGLVVLSYGLTLILQGYSEIEVVEIEGQSFVLDKLTSVNMLPAKPYENPSIQSVKVNFDTLVIFQGDVVGITATAHGVRSDVQAMAILFTEQERSIENMTAEELANEIELSKQYGTVIELVPTSNPPFHTRQFVPFLKPDQKIVIQGVVWTQKESEHPIYEKHTTNQIVTTVQPRSEKVPTETYKVMLMQLEEQRNTDLQQDRTNTIFLGFSWIGVALILILGGIDVLLRIRFDQNN